MGWIFLFLFGGCLFGRNIKVVEGEWDKPYESLGYVEVRIQSAQPLLFRRAKGYKRLLNRELIKKASPLGAEGLARVEYWPDLSGKTFPDGFAHARAEMIRFQKFPVEKEPPAKS